MLSKEGIKKLHEDRYKEEIKKFKKIIEKWDSNHISSLLEEDIDSLVKFITKELRK